jgi:lipoyl(octanoyl) transferase
MHLPKPIDVVGYVRYLEQVIIDSILTYGIKGVRVQGRTGVWVDTPRGAEKVAAIGIRVAEKVTMHGFALNCSNSLEPFDHIVACGIADAKATSLSALASKEITPIEVADLIEQNMGEIPNARG